MKRGGFVLHSVNQLRHSVTSTCPAPSEMKCFRQDGRWCLSHRQAPLPRSEADEQARGEPDKSRGPEERVL